MPPDPIAIGGWGLRPQTPSAIRLSTLAYSTRLLVRHLDFLRIRTLPLPKSWLSANRLQLQIFQSTISLAHKKILFSKVLMTSLHVICGLGPPNQKSWLRLCIEHYDFGTMHWFKYQRWSPRGRPWPRGHILKSLAWALASKPQVLGLGLETLAPRKLPCPRLEDSTIFKPLKFCRKTP